MSVRPYILVGESRLQALHTASETALLSWKHHWLSPETSVDISLRVQSASERPLNIPDTTWFQLSIGGSRIHCCLPPNSARTIIELLITGARGYAPSGSESALCNTLLQRLLGDFLIRLALTANEDLLEAPAWVEVQRPDDQTQKASGACVLSIEFSQHAVHFVLPPDFVRHLTRSTDSKPSPVSNKPLTKAIEATTIQLAVTIPVQESLSVASLENLAEGDIVLLDRRCTEPWDVVLTDGQPIASCSLGQQDGQGVIRLLPIRKK